MKSDKSSNKEMSKLEITEKLKILCLHGYRQTGDSFKSKLGSFRKYTGKYAEFVFPCAPHVVAVIPDNCDVNNSQKEQTVDKAEASTSIDVNLIPTKIESSDQRSWWFNSEDQMSFKGTNKCGPAFRFEESIKYLEKVWNEEGPFQGLLGFSQGACLVALICGLAQRCYTKIDPKFVIMASGFKSGSLVHMKLYEDIITIPSLHIYGETDEIITSDMSEALIKLFDNPQVVKHSGGHYFPATANLKQTYIYFFQDRLQEHLENKELAKIHNEISAGQDIKTIESEDSRSEDQDIDSSSNDTDWNFK